MQSDKVFVMVEGGEIMDNASCSVSYFWHRVLHCLEERLGGVAVASRLDRTEAISLKTTNWF